MRIFSGLQNYLRGTNTFSNWQLGGDLVLQPSTGVLAPDMSSEASLITCSNGWSAISSYVYYRVELFGNVASSIYVKPYQNVERMFFRIIKLEPEDGYAAMSLYFDGDGGYENYIVRGSSGYKTPVNTSHTEFPNNWHKFTFVMDTVADSSVGERAGIIMYPNAPRGANPNGVGSYIFAPSIQMYSQEIIGTGPYLETDTTNVPLLSTFVEVPQLPSNWNVTEFGNRATSYSLNSDYKRNSNYTETSVKSLIWDSINLVTNSSFLSTLLSYKYSVSGEECVLEYPDKLNRIRKWEIIEILDVKVDNKGYTNNNGSLEVVYVSKGYINI